MSFYNDPPFSPNCILYAPLVEPIRCVPDSDDIALFMDHDMCRQVFGTLRNPLPLLRSHEVTTPWLWEMYRHASEQRGALGELKDRGERLRQRYALKVAKARQAVAEMGRRDITAREKYFLQAGYDEGRSKLKEIGASITEAINNKDAAAAVGILRSLNGDGYNFLYNPVANRLKAHLFDFAWFADAVTFCNDCNELILEDGDEDHIVVQGSFVCSPCAENYVSDYRGHWIHQDHAVPIYDDLHDYERGNAQGYIQRREDLQDNDDDGNYEGYELFSTPRRMWAGPDLVAYLREQEEEARGGPLASYHGTPRKFTPYDATPSLHRPPLGVELEVYNEDRGFIVCKLHEQFNKRPSPAWTQLILERDGSLDDDYGFEIVTQPLGLAEWNDLGPRLLNTLRDDGTLAYQTGGTYGIHVNIARRSLSPLQEARMMLFLCAEENRRFVQCVAQRGDIYHAELGIGSLFNTKPTKANNYDYGTPISRIGSLRRAPDEKPKIMGRGKYCPINWKRDVGEFRIFQSTLNEESFFKNLEFVWALAEWTHPMSATGSSWYFVEFLKWLGQRPKARKDYKNLLAYLRRPKHYAHGSTRRLFETNPFEQYLTCKADASAELEEV